MGFCSRNLFLPPKSLRCSYKFLLRVWKLCFTHFVFNLPEIYFVYKRQKCSLFLFSYGKPIFLIPNHTSLLICKGSSVNYQTLLEASVSFWTLPFVHLPQWLGRETHLGALVPKAGTSQKFCCSVTNAVVFLAKRVEEKARWPVLLESGLCQTASGLRTTWLWSQLCSNSPSSLTHPIGIEVEDGTGQLQRADIWEGNRAARKLVRHKKAQRTCNDH